MWPLAHEQVTPAIVVVVQEDRTPSEKRHRNLVKPSLSGYVIEELTLVAKQRVMVFGVRGDEQVRSAVVVGVADGACHIGLFQAIGTAGESGMVRILDLLEFAEVRRR